MNQRKGNKIMNFSCRIEKFIVTLPPKTMSSQQQDQRTPPACGAESKNTGVPK